MNPFSHINPDTFTQHRNNGIGASEIAVLAGASEFSTPYMIWKQKAHNVSQIVTPELQKLFDAGHQQEPITLFNFLKTRNEDLANEVLIKHIQKKHFPKKSSTQIFTRFNHPKYDFMYCHPDMVYNNMNIEAKFSQYTKSFDFNDLTEEGIPLNYYIQIQYQMMCTGIKTSALALNYQGGGYYEYIPINPNYDLMEKMTKIAYDFWQLVERKEPPMPETRNDVKDLFPDKTFLSKTVPEELEMLTVMQKDRYNVLKKNISRMKKEQDKIKTVVSALMTDNNVLTTSQGETIAKITVSEGEKLETLKVIKSDYPKIYDILKKNDLIKEKKTERFYL
jgi:predicted phage-related endonuclease